MNAVQQHNTGIVWDDKKVQLFKDTICKGASNEEFELALEVCRVTGLNPFAHQIYFVKRWDSQLGRDVMTPQTSIDGFRLVAQRTTKYAGQKGPLWCGADGEWKDVWLSNEPPLAAKVGVMHHDFQEPLWRVAKFTTYKQVKKDGKLASFWAKGPELMLAKCAEALALRSAFPQELSGLYTQDEMSQASVEQETQEKDITSEVKKTTTQIAQDKFEAERGIKSAEAPVVPDEVLKVAGHAFEESEIQLAMVSTDANADKILYNLSGIFLEREKAELTNVYGGRKMTVAQIKAHIVQYSFDMNRIRESFAMPTLSDVAASDKMPDDADAF